ncbi:MAG: hypothetical protein K2U26_10730, partial [Cyclobacteriaceae bacterium]|nr:hypothetical protein [Cyclobacteriaceae bacterium]
MKYIVLSILFYLMYSGAQAQYTVRISVQGSATGCIGVLTGNNVSGTLKRSDGTVITTTSNSGASSFVVATSGGSSNSLSFLVSGSGSYACDCRDPFDPTSQIPGCITSGGASRSEVALNVSLSLGACGL